MPKSKNILVGTIALVVIALAAGPVYAFHTITWNPPLVDETIAGGATLDVSVSFTASRSLRDVSIWIGPHIRDVVTVSPEVVGDVAAGETIDLTISLAPDEVSSPSTENGYILVKGRLFTPWPRLFLRALPIHVDVWESAAVSTANGDITIGSPPDWDLSVQPDGLLLLSPNTVEVYDSLGEDAVEIPADVGLLVLPNEQDLTLQDFVSAFAGAYYENYAQSEEMTIDGLPAILYDDGIDDLSQAPVIVAFIDAPPNVVLLSLNRHVATPQERTLFEELLSTLRISQGGAQ